MTGKLGFNARAGRPIEIEFGPMAMRPFISWVDALMILADLTASPRGLLPALSRVDREAAVAACRRMRLNLTRRSSESLREFLGWIESEAAYIIARRNLPRVPEEPRRSSFAARLRRDLGSRRRLVFAVA